MHGLLSLVYLFSRLQNSDGGFSSGFQKGKKLTQILVAGKLKKKKKKKKKIVYITAVGYSKEPLKSRDFKYFVCVFVCVLIAQLCLTLYDSMDCSPLGFSVHGIYQARILEWLPFPSPADLPNPGIEPGSPALQVDALSFESPGKPFKYL